MGQPDGKHQVRLGAVQETLFIPLAARARETEKKHPVLTDPRAAELVRSIDYDAAKYGRGAGGFVTVLRTAIIDFWVRSFLAASALDEDWLPAVAQSRGPYFFVADGVLVYLPEDQVMAALARFAERFPGALLALDTYPKRTFDQQHRLTAQKGIDARWAWSCDDPRSLERFGLEVMESVTITRPPRAMRGQLPARYRYLMPLADPLLGRAMAITLFRCGR